MSSDNAPEDVKAETPEEVKESPEEIEKACKEAQADIERTTALFAKHTTADTLFDVQEFCTADGRVIMRHSPRDAELQEKLPARYVGKMMMRTPQGPNEMMFPIPGDSLEDALKNFKKAVTVALVEVERHKQEMRRQIEQMKRRGGGFGQRSAGGIVLPDGSLTGP